MKLGILDGRQNHFSFDGFATVVGLGSGDTRHPLGLGERKYVYD